MTDHAHAVLFTDIEGSTHRWEHHPQAMRAALEDHDRLIAEALRRPGVRIIKHTGDGVVAACPDGQALLDAAIVAQRLLTAHDWSAVGGLRVRMGLHIGEAHERGGDLFGQAMNVAARVMGGADGGQIVFTAAIARSVEVPPPWHVRELGRFRFRGVADPVTVFGLEDPSAPPHAPFASGAARLGNLPTGQPPLVGRDEVLALLAKAIDEPGLVTLVGPGGVGKTSVALAAAAGAHSTFPDGRWFVDLTTISAGSEVLPLVLATLGLAADDSPTAALGRCLAARSMLVVLDNCEHLVDEVNEVLRGALWAGHRATVLTTSRSPLRIAAERLVTVPALDVTSTHGSAVSLFVQRARRVDPAFRPDQDEQRAILALCRRLDGLPLAIELAAARTAMFTVAEIDALLSERFRLLRGPGGHRHDALERTIGWSYDLLSEPAARLLEAVALFDGPVDIEQVAAAAGTDVLDAADAITDLVDRSLVMRHHARSATYHLLESVRAFTQARTAPSTVEQAASRVTTWVETLTEQASTEINGPSQLRWFDRCDRALPSIRIAVDGLLRSGPEDAGRVLRLMTRTSQFWLSRADRRGVLRWLEQALGRVDDSVDPGLVSRAFSDASTLAAFSGDDRAGDWCEQSLAVSERAGLPPRPSALARRATLQLMARDVQEGLVTVLLAEEHLTSVHTPPEPPETIAAIGALLAIAGHPVEGVLRCRAAARDHEAASPTTAVSDLMNLGVALRPTDPGNAADAFLAAQRRATEADLPFYAANAGLAAGWCLRSRGDNHQALATLTEVLPLVDRLGMAAEAVAVLRAIAGLLRRLDAEDAVLMELIGDLDVDATDVAHADLGPAIEAAGTAAQAVLSRHEADAR